MNEEQVWDPLRKKMVALTPEERVRQWFIGELRDGMKVPEHMMRSEVGMRFGEGGKKEFRADIVVFGRDGQPLMIVECKRPDVELSQKVTDQALRYNNVMDVRFIVITNGHRTFMFRREGAGFVALQAAPDYDQMQAPVGNAGNAGE